MIETFLWLITASCTLQSYNCHTHHHQSRSIAPLFCLECSIVVTCHLMNHLRNNDRPKYSNNNDVILYSVPALNYVTYPRMEGNSCDKVNMLETTKTLFTRDMPQAIKTVVKSFLCTKQLELTAQFYPSMPTIRKSSTTKVMIICKRQRNVSSPTTWPLYFTPCKISSIDS